MKNQFKQFYEPTKEEEEILWSEAVFVFDTNVLIKAYEVRSDTREALLKAMRILSDDGRVWLAHQTVREFYFVRHKPIRDNIVILKGLRKYPESARALWEKFKQGKEGFPRPPADYPHADPDELFKTVEAALKRFEKEIDKISGGLKSIDERLRDDHVLQAYETMFEGKIGQEPDAKTIKERQNLWSKSHKPSGRPPVDEKGPLDYLIWQELLEHFKGTKKHVVLVTDDKGWHLENSTHWGPHPDLVADFWDKVGKDQRFWAYKSGDFLELAGEHMPELTVTDEQVDDMEPDAWSTMTEKINVYLEGHGLGAPQTAWQKVIQRNAERAGYEAHTQWQRALLRDAYARLSDERRDGGTQPPTMEPIVEDPVGEEWERLTGDVSPPLSCPYCGEQMWTELLTNHPTRKVRHTDHLQGGIQ